MNSEIMRNQKGKSKRKYVKWYMNHTMCSMSYSHHSKVIQIKLMLLVKNLNIFPQAVKCTNNIFHCNKMYWNKLKKLLEMINC